MASNRDAVLDATRAVPGIPRDDDGPVFGEPWEAHAFAMALTLHQRGLFSVAEKGVASSDTLTRYRDAWDHAADRTPHGSPIELRPEDFAR